MGLINNKWFQAVIVLVIANFFTPLGDSAVGAVGLIGMLIVFVPKFREMAKLDYIVNVKKAPNKNETKISTENEGGLSADNLDSNDESNASISEDIYTDNVTEQTSAEETATDKTVKDLIMSAVDGALKEFIANPPDKAYEGTSGYFSWYINLYDSDYEILSDKSGDDFCVNCDIGLLEEVIMNQTGDFSEVESDVKTTFESYLSQSDEQILQKDSSIIDITKSHFEIAVFEVVDDGADVWRYYREQHYFLNCVDSGMSGRDKALSIAATDRSQLSKLEDKYKNDKEIAMVAIENDALSFLSNASDDLKKDREIVMAAVIKDGRTLFNASDDLKNDREIVMAAVKNYGMTLSNASDDLKNDREIVMAAVKNDGEAIQYAPNDLKNDREIIMTAVSTAGTAIMHLSEHFNNDKEIVMTAASNGINWALEGVSDELKNDKEVIMAAVKNYGYSLAHASDELKNDKEVIIAAAESIGEDALEYASDSLKSDKDILELIKASH